MRNINVLNSKGLLDAIAEMKANNTPENQSKMMDKMVDAQYLAPVSITPPPVTDGYMANITLPPDAKLRFHMIENGMGQRFFLAFTSFEEMSKWRENANVQSIIVTFDDYAGMLAKSEADENVGGFVIDPFGANLVFSKSQAIAIKAMKDKRDAGISTHTIKEGEEVYIGEPVKYPTEMVDAMKKYLESQDAVKKAYLQLMCQGEDESYLIVLDYIGDKMDVFDGLAVAAKPYAGGMLLDIMGSGSDLGSKIADKVTPFFEK